MLTGYSEAVQRLIRMSACTEAEMECDEPPLHELSKVEQFHNAAHIAYHGWSNRNDNGFEPHLVEHLTRQTDWPGGDLVREVFGNPFRPLARAVPWRSDMVLAIARGLYADRTFEEAGCVHVDLLARGRSGGPHVLGCWALDWVQGRC
jgi:hypothetical protein